GFHLRQNIHFLRTGKTLNCYTLVKGFYNFLKTISMKTLHFILMGSAISVIIACGSGNGTTTASNGAMGRTTNATGGTDDTANRSDETTGTLYNANVNTNAQSRQPDPEKPATTTVNSNKNTERQQEMRRMYSSLNMTDDQIRRFEEASNTANETWKKNNPGSTMTNNYMRMQRDKNLKPILDESQYTQYQQWAKNNPNVQF